MTSSAKHWPVAVIFDLDGTLIDSAPDIANALNLALEKRGLAPFPVAKVKEMIGGGIEKLAERALLGRGSLSAEVPTFVADFVTFYRDNLTTLTTIYEGAIDLLELLQGQGKRLGLCTNKPQVLTLEILEQLDLFQYFSSVLGDRDGQPRKPQPAPLLAVLEELKVSPGEAVMVGDSSADVECARAVGVPVVAVSFGYSRVAPQALGADAVIGSLPELPKCFSRLDAISKHAVAAGSASACDKEEREKQKRGAA